MYFSFTFKENDKCFFHNVLIPDKKVLLSLKTNWGRLSPFDLKSIDEIQTEITGLLEHQTKITSLFFEKIASNKASLRKIISAKIVNSKSVLSRSFDFAQKLRLVSRKVSKVGIFCHVTSRIEPTVMWPCYQNNKHFLFLKHFYNTHMLFLSPTLTDWVKYSWWLQSVAHLYCDHWKILYSLLLISHHFETLFGKCR